MHEQVKYIREIVIKKRLRDERDGVLYLAATHHNSMPMQRNE